ncbi:MAG: DUF1993 domain-containing protein [Alphaproteobacteria bacterium]|nr:DUF1993 domain-containing protein [Alphaproteobacteria bacterium]
MTISMYQSTVPVYAQGLTNLSTLLKRAEAYAADKKIEPSVLINDRIYPDMFPLSRQVQIACDVVKSGVARLAGLEVPSFPDTETTFPELEERIQKTIRFIQTATAAQVDGSEDKAIAIKVGGNDLSFNGQDYLQKFVTPNFYFHIAVTYAILRHNGVDIGKKDFLGNIQ